MSAELQAPRADLLRGCDLFARAWRRLADWAAKLKAALQTPPYDEDLRDRYARELRERIFHPPEC